MNLKPASHPASHRQRGFGVFEVLLATGVGLVLWLSWINHQGQRLNEKNALNRLMAENGAMLNQISRAVLARLPGEAAGQVAHSTQWINLPELSISGLNDPPVTTFGTLWQSCTWRDADNRPFGAVWETQSTGYPISRTVLKNAGAESLKPSHVTRFKYEMARAASTEHSKNGLRAGIINANATDFTWIQEGTVPIDIPCLHQEQQTSPDTRLAALITPEDVQARTGSKGGDVVFHPHELAATLNTGTGLIASMGHDEMSLRQTVQGSGLTIDQAFLDRLVGREDNPDGHHGITVVLVGGGGGSGYVRVVNIPKERLRNGDFLRLPVGAGGTPESTAPNWTAGSLTALFAGVRGGRTCVQQYRDGAVSGTDECAPGGANGGAGNVWVDESGTVQRTAGTGGDGGSGGGVGFPLKAQCAAGLVHSDYLDKCGPELIFGEGGFNGGGGKWGKNSKENAVGRPGTGQGDSFLPLVDGTRFEGPVRDHRRVARLYEGDVTGNPSWSAWRTLDGLTIGGPMRSYRTGWADTGGYGLCFTRSPGRGAGLPAIDAGCLNADAAGFSPPNPLSVGRGYGAGGLSCWRRTAGGGPHNHCLNLPNAAPLTDAAASLADLANGAAGAVYVYWLEK